MAMIFKNLKQNKKYIAFIIVGILLVIFFYCGGRVIAQGADINRLKNQKEAYEQQLEKQKEVNAELEEVLESDNKDEYIEKKAREKGFVKSNEIVFYDISGTD